MYMDEFPQVDSTRLFKTLGLRKRYRHTINNLPSDMDKFDMADYLKLLSDIDSSLADVYSFITDNDLLLLGQMKRVS